jgi:two-component sensor histidine kinase
MDSGAADGIKLSVLSDPLDVGLDFAIPIGLLVTELVTNSFKHAFPQNVGDIAVVLERVNGGEVVLVVSDNGQGQTEAGPANALRHDGLGTTIISRLTAQLRGVLTVDHQRGTRTEIRIAEPVLS